MHHVIGRRSSRFALTFLLACAAPITLHAQTTVHGVVADPLGARIAGTEIQLLAPDMTVVAKSKSSPDGTFAFTAASGRYALHAEFAGFAPQTTATVYVGEHAVTVPTITLFPSRLAQQISVTTNGIPTPLAQAAAAVTVVGDLELRNRATVEMPLNLVPGVTLTQQGETGGIASLFIRGGSSTANKVLFNGVAADDVGGRFDYSTVAATDLDSIEVYRGPNSVLYGTDAAAGVVAFTTRRGTSAVPQLDYAADGGNFNTLHTSAQLSGAAARLDYYGGLDILNTGNSTPLDTFHDTTAAANLGYQLNTQTLLRFTVRNSTSASGVPNAYDFYAVADPAKQADQDLYLSGVFENRTANRWHSLVRYGATRKREQYTQFGTNGIFDGYDYDGLPVTIRGANGYSVTGQAILDYGGTAYPFTDFYVSNRDQLYAQSDYAFNAHSTGLIAFRYENERGVTALPYGTQQAERTNYDYATQLNGDVKNRLFYSLGGGLQKNQLFGTDAEPRLGAAYYIVRPGDGFARGTKLMFNFAKGLQEPSIADQTGSLLVLLQQLGDQPLAQQFDIAPIGALRSRAYDGGLEQMLFRQKAVLRAHYFHNEFGDQVEYVYTQALAGLGVPQPVIDELASAGVFGAYVNSLNYRAQGTEAELEAQPAAHFFVRAGYTWVDSKVERSFSSDALSPAINPAFPNVAIGAYAPLVGARPFRIPPHKAFGEAIYERGRGYIALNVSYVSRQDDSTFLTDPNFGNTMLLPNRNLDPSSERVDIGGGWRVNDHIEAYTQLNNLLSQERAGILGYPALPFNFRSGLKLHFGAR